MNMWLYIILLPVVISLTWMVVKMTGPEARTRKYIVVAIVVFLGFYFYVEKLLVSTGEYPFMGAQLLQNLAATMLVPLAYLLFGMSLGMNSSVRYFWRLLMIASPMLLDVVATIVDVSRGVHTVLGSRHSFLHLEIAQGLALELQLFSFIVVVQTIYVFSRLRETYRLFVVRNLYLSREGRIMANGAIGICGWVILTMLPTHSMMVGNHLLDVIIGGYSLIVSVSIAIMANYFTGDVIVDSDQKVVSLEDDADSILAESIRLLIANDKVYRNSNLRIEDLAAMVSSNRTYVARICRLKFGKTFTELMNYHRIEDAKALLLSDRLKRMDDVAAECGFSSASFFARVFKANVGMTPSQWRVASRAGGRPSADETKAEPIRGGIVVEKPHREENTPSR